ncbi:hypothetical protein D3C85_1828230 [compost metagenome]
MDAAYLVNRRLSLLLEITTRYFDKEDGQQEEDINSWRRIRRYDGSQTANKK